MKWNLRIQLILMVLLGIVALGFLFSVYQNQYIPTKLALFILMMMSSGLWVVYIFQHQYRRIKEIILVSTTAIYFVLFVSTAIHDIWKWEQIFDKESITKLSIVLFGLLALYGVVVYFRAKASYKRVKGNQQHNSKWRVSEREKRKLKESEDIYLMLGKVYEKPENK